MKFIFILQYDSFVRTLTPVISSLQKSTHDCKILFYKKIRERNWITDKIQSMMVDLEYQKVNLFQIYRELKNNYDVAVIGSVGARFIPKIIKYIHKKGLSTKIATGYAGALLNNHPKGFLKGVRRRSGSDLIWIPGDIWKYKILETGIINSQKTKLEVSGLPQLDKLHFELENQERKNRDNILFIEQPTFPESYNDRKKLVEYLVELARAFPQNNVIIKPRFSKLVAHTHRPKYHLPDILSNMENIPQNISVSDKALYKLFSSTKFAMTISSTGGLEALLSGVPTYFINDFCGEQNRYGSLDFSRIGSVISIQQIIKGENPEVDFEAAKDFLRFDGKNTTRLTKVLLKLCQ